MKIFLYNFLLILFFLGIFMPYVADARILFVDDVFENDSETYEIGANDTTSTDLTLKFGGSLAETLKWDAGNSRFELSDDLDIFNGLIVDTDTLVVNDTANSVSIGSTSNTLKLNLKNGNFFHERDDSEDAFKTYYSGSDAWAEGMEISNEGDYIIANSKELDKYNLFLGTSAGHHPGMAGMGTNKPLGYLHVNHYDNALWLGDSSNNSVYISFDDGHEHKLGWDYTQESFSTYNEELIFRTKQSATPTYTCSSTVAGMQWMDTDSGIVYVCDTSNSRNKWLSQQDIVIFGDENGGCPAGRDPNTNASCNVDWGNGIGTDSNTDIGFFIPYDITITGYGFSEDNDACTSGSFDLEVWGTGSSSDDNNYSLRATVASGLTGQAHNSHSLNYDVAGGQYILWGIDNNCGQTIDDWNMIIYYRVRHD